MQRVITELERQDYEEDEFQSLQKKLKPEKKIIKRARLLKSNCDIERLKNIQSKFNSRFDTLPKNQKDITQRQLMIS